MARSKPTDKYKQRAADILQPEEEGIGEESGKNLAANVVAGAPAAMIGGGAVGAKMLGTALNALPGSTLGAMGGAAALGSAAVPAVGAMMAERKLGKARKSIAETLPKIEAAKAKNAALRAARKPKGRPV